MGKIVIRGATREELLAATYRQELRDEWGNLIGYFDPAGKAAWGSFTAEEVERAFKQTGPGRTFEEMYRDYGA